MKVQEKYKKVIGLIFILIGIVLILLPDKLNNNSIATEPIRFSGFTEASEFDFLPKRVIIDDLSIDVGVRQAQIKNGFWEVFEDSAGWGLGTASPGEKGNQVIFAHAKNELFLSLEKASIGMPIIVVAENSAGETKIFTYEIELINEVYPNNLTYITPSDEEKLTLYTCSGFADNKRLIVIALPKENPRPAIADRGM